MKRTCDHWSGHVISVLCEKHLTADSFEPDSAIAATMRLAKRKRMETIGAIPTVFERPLKPLPSEASKPSNGGFQYSHSWKRATSTDNPGASQ